MKNTSPSAAMAHETLADRALTWIGLANLMFVIAFFTLFHVVQPAQAKTDLIQHTACSGQDLNAALQAAEPDIYQKLLSDNAAVPFSKGLLWRVEKDGVAPSYIFGTMHVTDPRALVLPEAAEKAFQASSQLVIETTEVLDPQGASMAMMARPDLMMFTDGTTLDTLIPEEDRPEVIKELAERGLPLATIRMMKPWMLTSMLSIPACEQARKGDGVEILDIDLARRAEIRNVPVAGLETIVEQLDAMASLPMENHIEGLVQALKMGDRSDDVFETMIALYTSGETGLIMPVLKEALKDLNPEANADADQADAYSEFETKMISNRNQTMAKRALPFVEKGSAFIAVGALHLPGEMGLVSLLKKQGYQVSAVHSPS